ncbi:MAG: tRNA 2-thiocytidine(32) synthetase TtcA [Candidatus Omnitrophica bacterium]|nr:tRNA 2-thiocytidine(32) synthetase TtcA [Candidatus Omnitrophota bacterium]
MRQESKDAAQAIKPKKEIPALVAISKKVGKAIVDFEMISEGDRIAVAVSGGKDSLSLMHILRHRQKISPVRFEFTAVHVDFGFEDFDPQVLVDYLEGQGFSYSVEKVDSLKGESYEDIDCFWWSRNRRKALFQMAGREGFTKVAFGHHLDDIAETIILNQFYRGEIGAMKPKLELFDGKLAIIRPLAYVRERDMEDLAKILGIDSMGQSKCGNDDTSHRMRIKKMLRDFEKESPMVVTNIFRSLQRVQSEYLIKPTGMSSAL